MKAINIMENTIENKAKFYGNYIGQMILMAEGMSSPIYVRSTDAIGYPSTYLELKPLSSVTDEDAIEVSKYMNLGHLNPPENRIKLVRDILMKVDPKGNVYLWVHIIDYLRSRGYALPWMGLSVEKQIEYGWIKLTD